MSPEHFEEIPEEFNEQEKADPELERLIQIKMQRDHVDRETAWRVAMIQIKEKKRYPRGKHYEGRSTD